MIEQDTRPKRYKGNRGRSSSELIRYWKYGKNKWPEIEPSYDMELGKAFELLCQGGIDQFYERFFVNEITGSWPAAFDINWLYEGHDLEKEKKYNKPKKKDDPPKLNKKYENFHRWIEACQNNPGKFPIAQDDYRVMLKNFESIKKIELSQWQVNIETVFYYGQWQVPLYWEQHGIKKKALLDLVITINGYVVIFDIKYYSSIASFKKHLKSGGWLQAVHYLNGAQKCYNLPVWPTFIFLVGTKSEKEDNLLAREITIDQDQMEFLNEIYHEQCGIYEEWKNAGKPENGYARNETVKVWA